MDIYRFIDSRDMREHLQKLNYAFTPPEAAFLVYRCKAATLEEMRLQEQQQANALAIEQNDLLDRQNSIAEKTRRDANIAAAVGAVQRHNTNKTIKKWMEKYAAAAGISPAAVCVLLGLGENAVTARFLAGRYDPKYVRPRLSDIRCVRSSPDPTAR